jgi:hypothetical protein
MPDFIWIIPTEKQSSLGVGGISPTYIIPQAEMRSLEYSLAGQLMWIVLRGQQDRYVAAITVKLIEKFNEGYYSGDFLIHSDLHRSIKLSRSYEDAKHYSTSALKSFSLGISEIEEVDAEWMKNTVSSKIEVKLAQPNVELLKDINLDVLPTQEDLQAKTSISLIVQKFSLDQLWSSGRGTKLNPVGNFAESILKRNISKPLKRETIELLQTFDPLIAVLSTKQNAQSDPSGQIFQRNVDLEFTEVEPEKIYAREFVASADHLYDLESALDKTSAAEELHQSMLRDITKYLKSIGIQPYESTSVDLMIRHDSKTKIYEIKSSSNDNLIAQASKGAFQIACYANAMAIEFSPLKTALILHKVSDLALEKFVTDALNYLGIRYYFYNPSFPWPKRIDGFLA